jgi:hypothetical protein
MIAKVSRQLKNLRFYLMLMILTVSCSAGVASPSNQEIDNLSTRLGIDDDCTTICLQKIELNEELPPGIRDIFRDDVENQNVSLVETASNYLYKWEDPTNNIAVNIQTDKQDRVQIIGIYPPFTSEYNHRVSMSEIFEIYGKPTTYQATSYHSDWGGSGISYIFIYDQASIAVIAREATNAEWTSIPEGEYSVETLQLLAETSRTFLSGEVFVNAIYFFVPEVANNPMEQLLFPLLIGEFKDWPDDNEVLIQPSVSR